jgi:hypothetical protein
MLNLSQNMLMEQRRYAAIHAEAFHRCIRKNHCAGKKVTMNTLFLEPTSDKLSELLALYWVEGKEVHDIELHKAMFLVDRHKLYEVFDKPIEWKKFQWRIHPNGHVDVMW